MNERNEDYEFTIEYFEDWLSFYKIDQPRSYETRLRQLKYVDEWIDENTNIDSIENIKYITLKKYAYELKSEDYAHQTIAGRIDLVAKVMEDAKKEEVIQDYKLPPSFNSVKDFKLKIKKSNRAKMLDEHDLNEGVSETDYKKMMSSVKSPLNRNQLIIALLWHTGVRASELVEIKDEDIDKKRRIIEVTSKKKSDESATRYVKYGKECDMLIEAWQTDRNRYQCFKDADEDYLLCSRKTCPMYPDRISHIVRETAWNAGIQQVIGQDAMGRDIHYINAHSLRHGHGTWAADKVGIHRVQQQLGHNSVEFTEEKYVHQDNTILNDDIDDPYDDIY